MMVDLDIPSVASLRVSPSGDRAEDERRKVGPSGVAWKGWIGS